MVLELKGIGRSHSSSGIHTGVFVEYNNVINSVSRIVLDYNTLDLGAFLEEFSSLALEEEPLVNISLRASPDLAKSHHAPPVGSSSSRRA